MAKVKDLKIRNAEYWDDRFTKLNNKTFNTADKSHRQLNKLFVSTYKEMNKEIQAFYNKYGVIKESPTFKVLSDGSKVQSGATKKLVVTPQSANVGLAKGTRLKSLEAQLNTILLSMSKEQNQLMINTLSKAAIDTYYGSIYEVYKGYGIGTSFNLLTPTVVNTLIKNPVNGQSFSTRVWNNRDKLANTVNQTINNGIIQGLSNGEMAKRLSSNMDTGYNVAKTLIDTEVTNTLSQAALLSYKESGIVSQYQYLATLDNRTSAICTDLDLEVFETKDAVTGLNLPPMHTKCRSSTRAYFDNSAEGLTRVARGLGGEVFTVPGDMTVIEFRKQYGDM